jgi:hypothetical protein
MAFAAICHPSNVQGLCLLARLVVGEAGRVYLKSAVSPHPYLRVRRLPTFSAKAVLHLRFLLLLLQNSQNRIVNSPVATPSVAMTSSPDLDAHCPSLCAGSLATELRSAALNTANPDFCISPHLTTSESVFHLLSYPVDFRNPVSIGSSSLFNDRSGVSRRSSSSARSLDDVTLNESDLDFSMDEDEEFGAAERAIGSNTEGKPESLQSGAHADRRKRHNRNPSEGDARYVSKMLADSSPGERKEKVGLT